MHTTLHDANKNPARAKQKSHTLQTKLPHTANKKEPNCKKSAHHKQKELHAAKKKKRKKKKKKRNRTLQTKSKVLRAQDDVKDWDRVSWFS